MELLVNSLSELDATAAAILSFEPNNRVFLFYGDMGAGKTTLIKSLCKALGVTDNISSPTFAIVNEYRAVNNTIYHFDFYRLKTEIEAMDMGFEEYLYSGNYCFIEWPEKIPELLPENYISINIQVVADGARYITVKHI
ncbi:tRNA (adenosine(37)-N6)-threonylcarbamoyltransferase complex ATPase subunit type 1 TsaE [Mucilaginibacter sp. E4BP6]|uniref:tRNA (adenosine(37)-N6)-threonylcarbamoyltransferase complex ATPase subunit type 1 TsaE n=1 Tax=Mucilaginibacter sp. E4BP6 TaxID=2723089 RepID=UPI0015CDE145|nr:tRNA (adenosine(37)-N6)-threonylcarbamoyltransferase complex ATPase subunit type 1 TsaE [Mucilaginibacter sp. E4BP6]NYE64836.1 tRNA threonylcarbamoyladenosine biosynthesis protein TsaE [Mucilaginibacter sp. E4BP6]